MPAAVALAGLLTFGVLQANSQDRPASWLAGAARPSVVEAVPTPVAEPATARAVETDKPATKAAVQRRTRRSSDADGRAPRRDAGMKRVGKALRLDRHLRRLF